MSIRHRSFIIFIIFLPHLLLIYPGCAAKTQLTPIADEKKAMEVTSITTPFWQVEWNNTLAKAKKEGRVTVYIYLGPEIRNAITLAFKERYGIELEMVSASGSEMAEKILRERRAGIFQADLIISGPTTFLTRLKPAGTLEKIEPELLLPEVIEPKAWYNGKLPFVDKDRMVFAMVLSPGGGNTVINMGKISKTELVSVKDLLNPKWKSKIVILDPTMLGPALTLLMVIAAGPLGYDFVRELSRQDLAIVRDKRHVVEWVVREKYLIGIGAAQEIVVEFQNAGSPLLRINYPETVRLSESGSDFALFNKASHPFARRVFINWLLSREGQTVLSRSGRKTSAREDVLTDHLMEEEIREPGLKYFDAWTEAWHLSTEDRLIKIKEIFDSFRK